jgi:hypothetical protein
MEVLFKIKHDGDDITDHVISYKREQQLCSGKGTFEMTLPLSYSRTFDPWDEIILFEDDIKKATYYIQTTTDDRTGGTKRIEAQDGSLKLESYFIGETYEIQEGQTTRYYIEKFLSDATVSYSFAVSDQGSPLAAGSQLGFASAYESITTLLQQSGWYLVFNANNTAIIGKLDVGHGSYGTVLDDYVLQIHSTKHDKMLRNRAVVWGMGDPTTSEWIFADITRHTPWDYDARDIRTVCLSNSEIESQATADRFAFTLINEFSRINHPISVNLAGVFNIAIGNAVYLKRWYGGKHLVTTIGSEGSLASGMVTYLVLDERCPRLFGYLSTDESATYVYAGTEGSGVYRKLLSGGATWSNYSSGLSGWGEEEVVVTDLHIHGGALACVTDVGGAYTNSIERNNWIRFNPSGVLDVESGTYYDGTNLLGAACTVDPITRDLIFGVNNTLSGEDARSWVVGCDLLNDQKYAHQVYVGSGGSNFYDLHVLDVARNATETYVSAIRAGGRVPVSAMGHRINRVPWHESTSYQLMPDDTALTIISEDTHYTTGDNIHDLSYFNGWTYPILQWDSAQRIYNYNLYYNSNTSYTAIRDKFDITWSGGWDIDVTNTSVPMISGADLGNLVGYGKFLWKDSVNDNVLYAVAITEDATDVITFHNFEINLSNSTYTHSTGNTIDLTGKSITNRHLQNGKYVYGIYHNYRYGVSYPSTLVLEYFKYDIENNILSTGTLGSFSATYDYYLPLVDFFVDRTGTDICVLGILEDEDVLVNDKARYVYISGNIAYGVSETELFDDNFHGYGGAGGWGYMGEVNTNYGSAKATDAMHAYIGRCFAVTDTPPIMYKAYRIGLYTTDGFTVELDKDTNSGTNLTTLQSWLYDTDKVVYNPVANDLGSIGGTWGGGLVSSKYNTNHYLMQYWRSEDTPYRYGVCIRDLPSREIIQILDPDDFEGYDYISQNFNSPMDDYDDGAYFRIREESSGDWVLAKIGITDGYLYHIYEDIDTDTYSPPVQGSFQFVNNGFIVRSSQYRNTQLMYPVSGWWYQLPPYSTILKTVSGEFTEVVTTEYPHKVEVSQDLPITTYQLPSGLLVTNPLINQSFSGDYGTYTEITTTSSGYGYTDGRIFDTYADGAYTKVGVFLLETPSGTMIKAYDTYSYDMYGFIMPSGITSSGIVYHGETVSGNIRHIETSNYGFASNPYMFLSYVDPSGISHFYQRGQDSAGYVEYSTGLPSAKQITVIRVDDEV